MAKKSDGVTVEDQAIVVEETVGEATFAELFERASAPFDRTHKRPGPGGTQLDYITGEQALSRVQEVYGGYDWSVCDVKMIGDAIVATGTLSVKVDGKYITRDGVGSAAIGARTDAAGAAKNAETNALKRAAAKFGVGLYLYNKDEAEDAPSWSPPTQGNFNRPPVQFSNNNSTGAGTTGVIEQVSQPSVGPDGKQRLGGVKVNGQWYNVSSYTPIDLSSLRAGMAVTVAHAPGKTFINGITSAGEGVPQEEAF